MKKQIYIILLLTFTSSSVYTQTAVTIAQDTVGTSLYYLNAIQQYIDVAKNSAATVKYQIKALEKLGEGGFDGLISYYNYQSAALGSLSKTVNSANAAQFFNPANKPNSFKLESWQSDFNEHKLSKSDLEDVLGDYENMFSNLASVTSDTKYFVKNTEARMDTMKSLREQAELADSPAKQAELLFQVLSLTSAQNEDQMQLLMSQNALLGNTAKMQEKQKELMDKRGDELFANGSSEKNTDKDKLLKENIDDVIDDTMYTKGRNYDVESQYFKNYDVEYGWTDGSQY